MSTSNLVFQSIAHRFLVRSFILVNADGDPAGDSITHKQLQTQVTYLDISTGELILSPWTAVPEVLESEVEEEKEEIDEETEAEQAAVDRILPEDTDVDDKGDTRIQD